MKSWWISTQDLRSAVAAWCLGLGAGLCGLGTVNPALAYPLDGDVYTGITRLVGYRLAADGEIRGPRQPSGARLPLDRVLPRLTGRPPYTLPEPDPQFSQRVKALLGSESDRYGVAVLDLSDPDKPRYAEVNGTQRYGPGSVGKLMVVLGVFQALADIYPDSTAAREHVLRDTMVTTDDFIRTDSHKVPFWNAKSRRLSWRPLVEGDKATLWTFLDWMLSASSNAAASTVMRELLLLVHYGRSYPVSAAERERFFKETPRAELGRLLARAMHDPVTRNGLDIERIRQGSFFTKMGKRHVPGVTSYADARELMRYLLLLEEGRLVDEFSSREIKRLLYMTQRRIRYASSPALANAAVYFKSGSFYRCRPEPGFVCRKYQGNVENWMNSVAIVESPAGERRLFYMVTVMSNVLRKNSAVEHQTLATRLQRLIEAAHPQGQPPSSESGK